MTIDTVTEIASNALYIIIKVSTPVLLVSLVVGLTARTMFASSLTALTLVLYRVLTLTVLLLSHSIIWVM